MKILELEQGSEAWKAHRKNARNASEAPIILGASDKTKRSELVKMKALGTEKEYSAWVEEVLFENGHKVEALARPIAEEIIGEELYPVTAESDDGYLSASFDGINMAETIAWECKQWNAAKAEAVNAGRVPDVDYWQVIQQLAVSSAEKLLYMVTDGTREGTVYLWVERPAESEFQTLLEGWKIFDEDVANYVHEAPAVDVVGKAPETLPALRIEVTGMVSNSNLEAFRETAMAVFGAINTDLQSDKDFANAEKTVKWCKEVEDKLAAAKENALAQTADIDALFKAIDDISAEARTVRLNLDKQVKAQKEQRRADIQMNAAAEFNAHIEEINKTLGGKIRMPAIKTDFPGAMKGKKTIASLRDAASTELARAKIEANQVANKIRINLETLRADAEGYESLFADAQQLVLKENDDLKAVISMRITEHKQAEEKRLEQERARIRAEEQRKAEAEAKKQQDALNARAEPAPSAEPAAPAAVRSEPAAPYVERGPTGRGPAAAPGKDRPSDQEIIETLALKYRVHESKVIQWLLDMDLEAASQELVASM